MSDGVCHDAEALQGPHTEQRHIARFCKDLHHGLTQHPVQKHDVSVGLYDGSVDELAVR